MKTDSDKNELLTKLEGLTAAIGNTPCIQLGSDQICLFAKLELYQLSGSAKIRPAFRIIREAILKGRLGQSSVVIESTSGNFGIALAHICGRLGLEFIPVIDCNIPREKEAILRRLCARVEKVDTPDGTGGFLLSRLERVRYLMSEIEFGFNPDQYNNPNNYLSYFHSLGMEIVEELPDVRRVFVSVSSGGCITGLSVRLKQYDPKIRIIAVDVVGSLIFEKTRRARHLSGIGAGFRSRTLSMAKIDEVILLEENEIIEGVHELVREQGLILGASSGAVYRAAKEYSARLPCQDGKTLIICPDDGRDYQKSVFDDAWVKSIYKNNEEARGDVYEAKSSSPQRENLTND